MGTIGLSFGNFRAQAIMFDKDTTVDIGGGMAPFPCLANTPYAFPNNENVTLGTPDVTVALMTTSAGINGQLLPCFAIQAVVIVP